MAIDVSQEQIYIYASHICSEYQKAATNAAMKGNRTAAKVTFLGPINVMDQSVQTAVVTLRNNGKPPDTPPLGGGVGVSRQGLTSSDTLGRPPPTTESEVERRKKDIGKLGSISYDVIDACDIFDSTKDFKGINAIWTPTSPIGMDEPYNVLSAWDDWLAERGESPMMELFGDSVEDYFNECLSCSLSFNFSMQMPSVNLLGELDKLLNQLEGLIDFIKNRLDPFSTLQNLCSLFAGIKWLCIPDLIMMMMALQALLMKYGMAMLNLQLDWTAIVGPILKAILDPIVSALEQILGMVFQPFDCIIGILSQVQGLGQTLAKTVDVVVSEAKGFGDNMPISDDDGYNGGTIFGSSVRVTGADEVGFKGGDWFPDFDASPGGLVDKKPGKGTRTKGSDRLVGEPAGAGKYGHPTSGTPGAYANPGNDLYNTERKTSKKPFGGTDDPKGVPLNPPSITLTDKTTVQSVMMQDIWDDIDMPGKLAITLSDTKNWIKKLFDNIILALKSLNKLLSGSLNLSVTHSGIMLLIIDIISMVNLLIKLGFKNWKCDDVLEDPEKMRRLFAEEWGDINWESKEKGLMVGGSDTGLFAGEIKVPDCVNGLSTDPRKQNDFKLAMSLLNEGITE